MNRLEECKHKVQKVRAMLGETGYAGVIIRKQPNFSWISAGGRGFIGLASESACAALAVTADGVYLAGNNIELPRLLAEELPQGFAEPFSLPWQEDGNIDAELRKKFGTLTTDAEQDAWFKNNRLILLPSEQDRFAKLGSSAAAILEEVCASLKPEMTEQEAAGKLSERFWAAGIEPITLLIAADGRSQRVRHYVPTAGKIRDGVICSICVRSGGLVASATRPVAFKKEFAPGYEKLLKVEAAVFAATRPGVKLGDLYKELTGAYEQNGLAGEWNNHHQGGLCGYLAREVRADPARAEIVHEGQAFAWNPSLPGAKCEDTVILGKDGIRVLTEVSPAWPVLEFNGLRRPDILRKFGA